MNITTGSLDEGGSSKGGNKPVGKNHTQSPDIQACTSKPSGLQQYHAEALDNGVSMTVSSQMLREELLQ
ncbi:hypothetical protein LWI28_028333 [Acer negundo]|uniref:Uncharacterized protein n=1 Tax=Acer negundo TaxID=4023 RepID=A0AAD5NNI1_ACENE|nr:hypothetical protein LWI28_028333 [Acer negundo]